MAIKKLKSNIPSVSLHGNSWGTTTTGTNILTGTSTTTGGYVYPSPSILTTSTNNTITWNDGAFINSDIIEYIDIFYQLMEIDMDYKRFSIMTKDEKKAFIRDIKLKKLIDEK